MCFREHILDPLTRLDIPVFHTSFFHRLLHIRRQSLPLPDALHDLKRKSVFYAHMYQIGHNIVPRTDRCGDRSFSFFQKFLCISQPHVCSVGQAGNPHQIGKILRFRIPQHLHDKFRTELRHSQAA